MNYLSKYENKQINNSEKVAQNTKNDSVLRDFCFVIASVILAIVCIATIKEIAKSNEPVQVPAINYDVFENGEKDA